MKKAKILLIIPAYNEEKCILNTYNKIIEYNKKNKEDLEVLVINDGSLDKTESILKENNIPHIELLSNLGIGGAVQTGYKYAYQHNYDIAIQFDGDGQHDVEFIKTLIEPLLKEEIDLVVGSRFINKDSSKFKSSFFRRVGIKLISLIIKSRTKQKIYDTTSGFRAANKRVIEYFAHFYPLEYPEPISTVDILLKKYKIKEVAVSMNERSGGKSSIRTWKNVYYMINVIFSIILMKKGEKK